MVILPRVSDEMALSEAPTHAVAELRDHMMTMLFGLVERHGWRWATFACALAVLVVSLGVTAAIGELVVARRFQLLVATVVICVLAAPCLAVAFKLVEHLGRTRAKLMVEIDRRILAEHQLRHLAATDDLTGLGNRRQFLERGRDVTANARRHDQWCSFAVVDVDQFKTINDRRGHLAGDEALVRVAALLKANLRAADLVARVGGDEFVVLMPLADPEAARSTAERIRTAVRQDSLRLGLSVSIGVAAVRGEDVDLESLMAQADRALYAAKNAGRNRVVLDAATSTPWPAAPVCGLSIAS
jgi:diguanylate cyclase (GGDEF)-like protein